MVLKGMCRCSLVIYRRRHSGFQRSPVTPAVRPRLQQGLGCVSKTELMHVGDGLGPPPIIIGIDPIEFTSFLYLGLEVTNNGDLLIDINKSPELPEVLLLNTNIYSFLVKIKQTILFFFIYLRDSFILLANIYHGFRLKYN